MDASARRRLEDGGAATARATGRLAERTTDLLRAALRTEETTKTEHTARITPAADAPVAPTSHPLPGAPDGLPTAAVPAAATGPALPAAEGRIERALALVERIERFVRSGRPSLALTLRGGIPGRLEVERVGPGAVSLRLSSPRAPSASELGDLRQALEARGLAVRSLEARRLDPDTGGSDGVLTASAGDACSPCP
jgi:hypothetical protein